MKRKSELYDPTIPESDSDDDNEEDDVSSDNESDRKDDDNGEVTAKIDKAPIKMSIPITIGKQPDGSAANISGDDEKTTLPHKNGSSQEHKSPSSVRFRLYFSGFVC